MCLHLIQLCQKLIPGQVVSREVDECLEIVRQGHAEVCTQPRCLDLDIQIRKSVMQHVLEFKSNFDMCVAPLIRTMRSLSRRIGCRSRSIAVFAALMSIVSLTSSGLLGFGTG